MSLTFPESEYSLNSVTCCSICCAGRPVYVHTTLMTGMSTSGSTSVGVWRTTHTPDRSKRSAITTNVYGRRSARRTIHMGELVGEVEMTV